MTFLPRVKRSPSVLDKRIPSNPKYSSVHAVIDTGAAARKDSKVSSDQQVSKRRGELFKRVKNSRLAQLLETVSSTEVVESVYDLGKDHLDETSDKGSVIKGIAPSVRSVESIVSSDSAGIVDSRDFLLLDLRSEEEFKKHRIILSTNHPGTSIARDMISSQLSGFRVKSSKGRYLLVYHSDEKKSAYYATLLSEKGWEEVYINDGGFEEFKTSYPELTEGELLQR